MWRWNCFVFGVGRGAGERLTDRLYEVKVGIGQGLWSMNAPACIAENYHIPKDLCAAVFRVLSNCLGTLKFIKQYLATWLSIPIGRELTLMISLKP